STATTKTTQQKTKRGATKRAANKPAASAIKPKRQKKTGGSTKRKVTPYGLFTRKERGKLKKDYPDANPRSITAMLRRRWEELPLEEREAFETKSDEHNAAVTAAAELSDSNSDPDNGERPANKDGSGSEGSETGVESSGSKTGVEDEDDGGDEGGLSKRRRKVPVRKKLTRRLRGDDALRSRRQDDEGGIGKDDDDDATDKDSEDGDSRPASESLVRERSGGASLVGSASVASSSFENGGRRDKGKGKADASGSFVKRSLMTLSSEDSESGEDDHPITYKGSINSAQAERAGGAGGSARFGGRGSVETGNRKGASLLGESGSELDVDAGKLPEKGNHEETRRDDKDGDVDVDDLMDWLPVP
ncbi:hypothetical protein HK102_011343, partial [Quaeritorhiza haematococci]